MNPPSSEAKYLRYAVIAAVTLVAILWLFTSVEVVGVGQVGIVTRFGQINREAQSGIALKLPTPFERLDKIDVKTQADTAKAEAASIDLQDVFTTVVTNYHIDPAKVGTLYRTVGVDYKARIIDPAIQESVKAATAQYPIADLVVKRPDVKANITKSLTERLARNDIIVDAVSITNLTFSPAYTQAIEQKQVAQQAAEKAVFDTQKAKQEAQSAIEAATGQAEAQRLIQQSATSETLEQQAIARWDGKLPTYLGQGSVFNIPLSK